MSLVNETLKFQMYYTQKCYHFLPENVRIFSVLYNFSAKTTATIDFVSTVRLNKSLTNYFVKLMMLLTLKEPITSAADNIL